MNINETKKRILMLTLATMLGVTGCGGKNDRIHLDKSKLNFNQVLAETNLTTCLNEYIKSMEPTILDNVYKLEQYIEISDKIAKAKIEKMYVRNVDLSSIELLGASEIEKMLEDYLEDRLDEEKLFNLTVQKKLVDHFIVLEGYKISSDLALITLKAKIADSYGLGDELAAELMKTIVIPSKVEMGYENGRFDNLKNTIIINDELVKLDSTYKSFLALIYELQENHGYDTYDYNKERNKMIRNAINDTEEILIKNKKIKIK